MANFFDYLRAVALIAGFAAGFRQRKNALIADMVFTGWLGLCLYLFTGNFMEQQVKDGIKIDQFAMFGFRTLGSYFFGTLVMMVLCRKSRDDNVIGSLLWSRIVGMMMVLLLMVFSQLTYTKVFNDRHMWFTTLLCGLVWLSSVVQMVRTKPPVGRKEEKGALSIITRLYFLCLFVFGMAYMAFPKVMVGVMTDNVEDIHLYIARICGALLFGNVFVAWYVPCFRHTEDRKSFFIAQCVVGALTIGALEYCYVNNGIEKAHCWKTVAMCTPYLLPLAGLLMMLRHEHILSNTYSLRSRN